MHTFFLFPSTFFVFNQSSSNPHPLFSLSSKAFKMKFTLATAALFAAVTAVQADTYGGKYQDPANLPAK